MGLATTRQGFSPTTVTVSVGTAYIERLVQDFTGETAEDLTDGAPSPWNGWTPTNPANFATFGPDGSTGVRMVSSVSSNLEAGTAPGLQRQLSGIWTPTAASTVVVDLRISALSAGNYGRLVAALVQGTRYTAAGAQYVTSPGRFEMGGIADSAQWTDPSTALTDSTDCVVQVVFDPNGATVYDLGSWTGTWPEAVGGTVGAWQSHETANGQTSRPVNTASSSLFVGTYRASGTTNMTLHGVRIRSREA